MASFLLYHHCMTQFFVPELAQKSVTTIWNDRKIISVHGEAELCCYLGFLENRRHLGDMGDNLKSEEWGDVQLNCIFLGVWMSQERGFGRGQGEEHPLCQAPELGKSSHEGREPVTTTGCFTWIISDLCWFSPPCSFCDDPNFKTKILNGLNFTWKTKIGSPFRILFCCPVHERSGEKGMEPFSPSPSMRQPLKRTAGVPWPTVWKPLPYF